MTIIWFTLYLAGIELMDENNFKKLCEKIVPKCDILVLAGDIGNTLYCLHSRGLCFEISSILLILFTPSECLSNVSKNVLLLKKNLTLSFIENLFNTSFGNRLIVEKNGRSS
jgi:hypothetical protein